MGALDYDEHLVCVDQTYPNPVENVAAEQILLEYAEAQDPPMEILRIWQPAQTMVVLGRGGRVADDIYLDRCRKDEIPVVRRISGGGTIVAGSGCLMYTVVLSLALRPGLRDISFCHQYVGDRLRSALARCGQNVQLRGHSDLCLGERKFSGNALRIGRSHLIYHGTLLVDFDLELISKYLKLPPRRPDYRRSRDHLDFVTNLPVDQDELIGSIKQEFGVQPGEVPIEQTTLDRLLLERYDNDTWNLRL